MSLEKTEKQSYESYFIHADFTEVMEDSETIVSYECTAIDAAGEDATGDVLAAGSEIIGSGDDFAKLYVRIKDGVEEKSPYHFTVKIVTSTGNKWEHDGNIVVKEK